MAIKLFCDICLREIVKEKFSKLLHWVLSTTIEGRIDTIAKEELICEECQAKLDKKIEELKGEKPNKT